MTVPSLLNHYPHHFLSDSFLLLFQEQPDCAGCPRRANSHHLTSHQRQDSVSCSRGQVASGGRQNKPVGRSTWHLMECTIAQPYLSVIQNPYCSDFQYPSFNSFWIWYLCRRKKKGWGKIKINITSQSNYESVSENDMEINSKIIMTFIYDPYSSDFFPISTLGILSILAKLEILQNRFLIYPLFRGP